MHPLISHTASGVLLDDYGTDPGVLGWRKEAYQFRLRSVGVGGWVVGESAAGSNNLWTVVGGYNKRDTGPGKKQREIFGFLPTASAVCVYACTPAKSLREGGGNKRSFYYALWRSRRWFSFFPLFPFVHSYLSPPFERPIPSSRLFAHNT